MKCPQGGCSKNITLNEFKVDHKTRNLWLAQANSYKYVDHRSYANVVQDGKAVVQTPSTTAPKTSTLANIKV